MIHLSRILFDKEVGLLNICGLSLVDSLNSSIYLTNNF